MGSTTNLPLHSFYYYFLQTMNLRDIIYAEGDKSLELETIRKNLGNSRKFRAHKKRQKAHETLDQLLAKIVTLKTRLDKEWIVTKAIHAIRDELSHLEKDLVSTGFRKRQHLRKRLVLLKRELRVLRESSTNGGITIMSPNELKRMVSN